MDSNEEVKEVEKLATLRNSVISPYVAMDWELEADFPKERRLILKRYKKLRTGWFIVGLLFYIIPGLIYLLVWSLTRKEKKTLMY